MFCANCGLKNARGQRFCRRCGTNLLALDLARDFISEVAVGQSINRVEPGTILKIIALISSLGMLFVTGGVIALSQIQNSTMEGHQGPPMNLFLAVFGCGTIVLICGRLLRLLKNPKLQNRLARRPQYQEPSQLLTFRGDWDKPTEIWLRCRPTLA